MSQGAAHSAPYASEGGVTQSSAGLFRSAGYALYASIATLIIAGVALALFFGGAGAFFGPVNDLFTAATFVLMIPAVLAVRRLAAGSVGSWFSMVSLATIAGLIVAAGGFVLLVVGVIDLQASFATLGVGMLPFLVWVGGLAVLSLRTSILSRTVGRWIVGFFAVTAASIVGAFALPMDVLSMTLAPALFVTLAGWLVALGRDLIRSAGVLEARGNAADGQVNQTQ